MLKETHQNMETYFCGASDNGHCVGDAVVKMPKYFSSDSHKTWGSCRESIH
jgi:hypothetical protein